MDAVKLIRQKAKAKPKRIVLPEYDDLRVQQACRIIEEQQLANILLLSPDKMDAQEKQRYAREFYRLRKAKGMDLDTAMKLMQEPLYYAFMLAREGKVDGLVAGASHTTPDMVRAAIHCLGVDGRLGLACSCFIMTVPDCSYGDTGTFIFADCGIVPDPNPRQLACIAILAAELGKKVLDLVPRVAFLSYSTKKSARGNSVDKIAEVKKLIEGMSVDFAYDGELQLDAAIVPEVSRIKDPGGILEGRANILVFPNLESGNIGYKLVERLAKARAIGPLVLGLNKPCSDLSRGCSAEDVVDCVALTAIQAQ
jgi:phosphate acetyltransferase